VRLTRPFLLLAPLALAACGAGSPPYSNLGSGGPTAREVDRSRGGVVGAMELPEVAPGQALAFGEMAVVCDMPEASMGPAIEANGPYVIHDTAPNTAAPRVHYVTGFADGCARQVTAALALFGDLSTYETMRASGATGRSSVDAAYEVVRREVCGTSACASLAEDTVFLSVYPALGAPDSAEILLHAGEVVAAEI
jgi:hypothetical protein